MIYHGKAAWFLATLFFASAESGQHSRQSSENSACAKVAAEYSAWMLSSLDLPLEIGAETAIQCLRSMPFNQTLAAAFVNETLKYIQFQSTLDTLKHPPATYQSPATDIVDGFQVIGTNIENNAYLSQYDFDLAINDLMNTANDGHFLLRTCSLRIFDFYLADINLISISPDGVTEPEVWVYDDAPFAEQNDSKVSPVRKIAGEPVIDFLKQIAAVQRLQDPDARYNAVFPLHGLAVAKDRRAPGAFKTAGGLYPGRDSTLIEFENGTIIAVQTGASFRGGRFDYSDGKALFGHYCISSAVPSSENNIDDPATENHLPPAATGPHPYPAPLFRDPYNQVIGFEMKGHDLNNTVVMFVPDFDNDDLPSNQSAVASDVAGKIVDKALKAGKSRIIIDVSGNSGGDISRGFNLFKLFFPATLPYSATRFRTHEAIDLLGKVMQTFDQEKSRSQGGPPAFRGAVTPNQTSSFLSMSDLYNGGTFLDTNMSSLLANFNFTSRSTEEDPIQGFGGIPTSFTSRPFEPENIIIVGDGWCSSTCTTFVNLMVNYGGVRSVVFGGRPNGDPAMQLMGGVRSGQSASWRLIDKWVSDARHAVSADSSILSIPELQRFHELMPIGFDRMPLVVRGGAVTFRNAYQEGEDTMPLQFAYQSANCRRYWTWENIIHPETMWRDAARAVWGDGTCIGGQTATNQPVTSLHKSDIAESDAADSATTVLLTTARK